MASAEEGVDGLWSEVICNEWVDLGWEIQNRCHVEGRGWDEGEGVGVEINWQVRGKSRK